jgi:beta-glucanase (GH16 family)
LLGFSALIGRLAPGSRARKRRDFTLLATRVNAKSLRRKAIAMKTLPTSRYFRGTAFLVLTSRMVHGEVAVSELPFGATIISSRLRLLMFVISVLVSVCGCASRAFCGPPAAAPPGWRLVWSDDFDAFDGEKWDRVDSYQPTNNSKQAYLAEQVSVADGNLALTAEKKPAGELPYRSGQVISKYEQRLGRWEVRAKLPTTPGMWPAIWLLPTESKVRWPSGGEIDIIENRGNRPTLTSSAFHYGTNPPFEHSFVFGEQQTSRDGKLVSYPEGFHTYAVDWLDDQLRFYVDDVNYYTVYDEEVGGYLSQHTLPMRVMLNTAVGGDFLPGPDESTVWPQKFLIDWVRVYQRDASAPTRKLQNGSFDEGGGSLAGWTLFGNRTADDPNVLAQTAVKRDGTAALKLFGQFVDHESYSGVAQGITVAGGKHVRVKCASLVRAEDGLTKTDNHLTLKIEFYDRFGAKFDSSAMLGTKEDVIADQSTPTEQWQEHALVADVPSGAVEARVALVFTQPAQEKGAVYVDGVEFDAVTN